MNTLIQQTPGEIDVYQSYTEQMFSGQTPYQDYWFEYPPGILALGSTAKIFSISPDHFFIVWQIMIFVAIAVAVSAIRKSLQIKPTIEESFQAYLYPKSKVAFGEISGVMGFLAVVLSAGVFLTHRYDIFATIIVLFGVIAMRHKKYSWAVEMFWAGFLLKLYPIMFIPLAFIHAPRKEWGKMIVASILPILITYFVWTPVGVQKFLEFHSDKSVQIESIQGMLHRDKPIVFEKFSYVYENATPAKSWSLIFMSAMLVYCFVNRKKQQFAFQGFLLTLAFIITGNVFSPQYILWLASFVPFLNLSTGIAVAGLMYLTNYYFQFYDAIIAKSTLETLLLNIRNVFLILLFAFKLPQED